MIPTAESILSKYISTDKKGNEKRLYNDEPLRAMIEFAKLHCIEQAKTIYNNATASNKAKFIGDINCQIDEDSILNAYPLDLIK